MGRRRIDRLRGNGFPAAFGLRFTTPPYSEHQRDGHHLVASCGALHLHAGLREGARELARRNIDAVLSQASTR